MILRKATSEGRSCWTSTSRKWGIVGLRGPLVGDSTKDGDNCIGDGIIKFGKG
jgi:hypothetical protein